MGKVFWEGQGCCERRRGYDICDKAILDSAKITSQGMKQDRWRGTATDRVPNMAILKMKLESWKGSMPKRNGYVSLGKDLKSMSEGQRWHIHALIVSPLLK